METIETDELWLTLIASNIVCGITKKNAGNYSLGNRSISGIIKIHYQLFHLLKNTDELWSKSARTTSIMQAEHGNRVHLVATGEKSTVHDGDAIIYRGLGGCWYPTGGCPTYVFYDHEAKLSGIIHAGWRSVSKNIIKRFIDLWEKNGGRAASTTVTQLPAIYGCCLSYIPDNFRRDVLPRFTHLENTDKDTRMEYYVREEDRIIYFDLLGLTRKLIASRTYEVRKASVCICCSGIYNCYRCDDTDGIKYRNAVFVISANNLAT